MYMVNQPLQTNTTETIKTSTLVDNQQQILNTVIPTITAYKFIHYPDQQDNCYGHLELNQLQNMIYSDMTEGNVFRVFLPQESEFRPETVSTVHVIGEELNTPVINYTRPDFNLYTKTRSTESLKEQSTGSMLNNNNPTTININSSNNNNPTANQSSIINAADVWCSDKLDLTDYQPLLFSPDSAKSSNSPSGLNSSDLTEESFIFETTACDTIYEPVKYSQDYEDFAFVDEINQITKLKEFNTDDYQSKFKIEEDDDDDITSKYEARAVLYQDTMITGLAPPTILLDEDSYLVTVNNFDDLIIKPENNNNKMDTNVSNINVDSSGNSQVMICEQNLSDYILTPAPSPKSPTNPVNHTSNGDIDDCENSSDCYPANDMNQASSPVGDRLYLEHNYNLINTRNSCKRKLVTVGSSTRQQEKRTRRVQPLKLKIPVMRALRQDSVKIVVNTPDITEDILSMEDEKFDLINFIDSNSLPQEKNLTDPTIDLIELRSSSQPTTTTTTTTTTKPPTPLDLEAIINEQCPVPAKRRRRNNSYDNPGSVQSMTSTIHSDDSSTHPAPKRRGRPPKTESVLPSPSEYKHLSEADWKYLEMRNKNNEASRRSRINRKDREHLIESEARELENQHRILADEEKALLKQVAKWRQAVMKLALI